MGRWPGGVHPGLPGRRLRGAVVPALWPSVLDSSSPEGRQGSRCLPRRLILSLVRARPHQDAGPAALATRCPLPEEPRPHPTTISQPPGIHGSSQAGRCIHPPRAPNVRSTPRACAACRGVTTGSGDAQEVGPGSGEAEDPEGHISSGPTKTKSPAAKTHCIHVWRQLGHVPALTPMPRRPECGRGGPGALPVMRGRAVPRDGLRSQLVPRWVSPSRKPASS